MDQPTQIDGRLLAYPKMEMLVLSHSSRTTLRNCMRKFEFRQFYGENAATREESFAAEVGKALHAGLQTWLSTRDFNRAVFSFGLRFPYEIEYEHKQNSTRSLEACFSTLEAMIKSGELDRYEIAKIRLPDGEIKDAVEVPFALRIVGSPFPCPVWFVGFIDCILYDRVTDSYVVIDIKTTRMQINDYSARYEFDEQCVPYAIILEHILGKPIDALKVTYLSTYVDLLEPEVKRYTFDKTEQHVIDWQIGLCDDIERLATFADREWFPRATDGGTCFSWNRPCQYIEYCSYREPDVLNRIIDGAARTQLFHDGAEPWFVADLQFISPANYEPEWRNVS